MAWLPKVVAVIRAVTAHDLEASRRQTLRCWGCGQPGHCRAQCHPRGPLKSRFMTDAARREQESLKKKMQPKLSLTLSSSVSRGSVSAPPRHSSGSLTPPVTPPITPSSSFRSSTPTGSEYDEEEVDYEESDSDESWTTESAISSESILSSMCMNGGDEKPFACPVPGCKKRYKAFCFPGVNTVTGSKTSNVWFFGSFSQAY
ncbi:Juxtaposed with another zinc finger protein 1 [Acipenser ruthenus]|uniref:Juxtaposed with another zinc finger protein 1 n=1 Tax=Acipenser ruthenus TaxID=7906 RepID=A0A662YZE4_ACIRT|nr:Juxtaposed with another zinc finger protein 1 [Acipenser ruthenus]